MIWHMLSYMIVEMTEDQIFFSLLAAGYGVSPLQGMNEVPLLSDISH
jgi:hypothetical protein